MTCIIRGSWGDLTIHTPTGHIISYDDNERKCWEPEERGYHDIAFFDPATLEASSSVKEYGEDDILDVGYWTKSGAYVPRTIFVPPTTSEDYPDRIELAGLLT